MSIAGFDVQYLSHVCFVFTSPGGAAVVTDPFFAAGFTWKDRWEAYLTPPAVHPADIRRCDAVFISHIHGDHCDPEAVRTIVRTSGAAVWAPPDVIEAVAAAGVPADRLMPLSEGRSFRVKDLAATAFTGYDNSLDEQGRANKFSLLLEAAGKTIFYSGDCHDPPPAMAGRRVDALFAWPHTRDDKVRALVAAIPPAEYVLMHGDRFEPGDFLCNLDLNHEAGRVRRLAPGVRVTVPERARSLT